MKRFAVLLACAFLSAPAFAQDHHDHQNRAEHPATRQHVQAAQLRARQQVHHANRRAQAAHTAAAHANREIQASRRAGARAQHQTRHYNNVVRQEHRQTQQVRRDYSRWHRNATAARRFHAGIYRRPAGWTYRRWSYGQTLPAPYRAGNYFLGNFASFGLVAPPDGAVWVRYGSDALLIDRESGEIIQTEYNVFY